MTLVSQLITDAFRKSNILALGTTPSAAQQDEALRYLQRIVKGVFGYEAGDPLVAFPIGSNHINRPSGYPWWDTVPTNDWFVPKNTRCMLNLSVGDQVSLYLHPDPDPGSRFAVIDVSENLSQVPVTVYGNGRLFENQFQVTLDQDGYDAEWFFREDLGNWVKYAPIILTDVFPFPEEFDDYFIGMLILQINPSYGAALDDQTKALFTRAKNQLMARYTQSIDTRSELGLIRTARVAQDRDMWGNTYWLYQPNAMFDKGWPW